MTILDPRSGHMDGRFLARSFSFALFPLMRRGFGIAGKHLFVPHLVLIGVPIFPKRQKRDRPVARSH